MSKRIKNIVGALIAGIVIYNSIYFRPLDEKLAEEEVVVFDVLNFVDKMWDADLLTTYDSATDFTILLNLLVNEPNLAFEKEAQALGIGNIGYFKVQGEGIVLSVNENNVMIKVGDRIVEIETEFIFGNAVRDASGLIKINDYDETSDFNSISESINDKIRNEVVPPFKLKVAKGDRIVFKGAIELNNAHLNLDQPEVIPVSLQIVP